MIFICVLGLLLIVWGLVEFRLYDEYKQAEHKANKDA